MLPNMKMGTAFSRQERNRTVRPRQAPAEPAIGTSQCRVTMNSQFSELVSQWLLAMGLLVSSPKPGGKSPPKPGGND